MALPKDEVLTGLLEELASFEDQVRSLDETELATPSRCEGWAAGDVARHVIGGMADVVTGRFDGLGTPEYTRRQVEERSGRSGSELADELAGLRKTAGDLLAAFDDTAWASPGPAGYDGTIGDGIEALWYDTYLHADDIRAALRRPSVRGGGLRASVSHVAFELGKRDWGPATLALEDMPAFDVGGGGRRIEGDPLAFVLAATGRADPAQLGLDASVNIYAG